MSTDYKCVKIAFVLADEIFCQDFESDSFKRSNKCFTKMIQNKDQQFLVVDKELLKFESRNEEQCRSDDCHFKILHYKENGASGQSGMPVILTVSDCGKCRMVFCSEEESGRERRVCAKVQEPPVDIPQSSHEAVFFLQKIKECSQGYRLESSRWPHWFLTFKMESKDLVKLVLRKVEDDVVDEGFTLRPEALS